jgi:4-amino-4-deoxy-L-arabinose transferase-like glycosyltransferase
MLILWRRNTFKACVSAVLLLLFMFVAWHAWAKHELTLGSVGFAVFLLCLACGPWILPRLGFRAKRSIRTASGDTRPERNSAAAATSRAEPLQLKNNVSNAARKISAEERLANLHGAARKKNNGPPATKMRAFERTRATQWRIKRYTRPR